MAIFTDGKGFFRLVTKNTEYQISADKYGVLKHLWYGDRVDTNMSYLLEYSDVGFSGNIYEAENERNYSLDTLPLEYSCKGIGDYRISAVSIVHGNGSEAIDLRYKDYRITKGKYSINGLPAVYASDKECETLEITLCDTASETEVILRYGVIEKYDIITRCAVIKNCGETSVKIRKASSMCLDIPHGDWEWINFYGRHTLERIPERKPFFHGIQELSSTRGTSSHQQNPSIIICSPDCNETKGECIGAFFVYSGSFQIQSELDQLGQVRLIMGINPELFEWNLGSGEEFETPETVMTYSNNGLSQMSYNFHRIIREHICRGKYKLENRPVLINNWEATYFDFDDEKILKIAKQASESGVDMFVLDDGWFGKRNNDNSGLGDWFVNRDKIRGGLKPLTEKLKDMGLKFGIWFEPEMISEDSELYRNNPDWAIKIPKRKPNRSRYQLVLDMSRKDVQDYLFKVMGDILRSADISYVKWDMNRSICDWYSSELDSEHQRELPHRYVLGLYSLLERLTKEFPNILFEGCSGGGGRFDAGMLYYCPQIWCSDDTDAFERTKIQYGTSYIYPVSAVGSHVSTIPNHQTGRVTPIETRAITAMAGSFGYELDLGTLSENERNEVKKQINHFKEFNSLIHNGRYFRLTNPLKDNYAVWSYVSENSDEILVHGVIFQTEPNMKRKPIRLIGIEKNSEYINTSTNEVYTGSSLMNGGILLPQPNGDYFPVEIHLVKVKRDV